VTVIRVYRLCRVVTYIEYCDVSARSLAEARRRGFGSRRVRVKETHWREVQRFSPPATDPTL